MADELLLKQLDAVIDGKTTAICLHTAGQIRAVDAMYETPAGDFDEPPFHIHCRSISVPWIAGMVSDQRRLANDEIRKRPREQRDLRLYVNRIPPPTYKGVSLTELTSTATPRSVQAADSVLYDFVRAQPGITRDVAGWIEQFGGKVQGLGFRVKGRISLAAKIAQRGVKTHIRYTTVASKISDVLRYTGTWNEARYASRAQSVVDSLREGGYAVRVKNTWGSTKNPYRGINLACTDANGLKFEIQLHTPTSLKVKEGELHELYKQMQFAEARGNQAEVDRLVAAQFRLSATIPEPPGARLVH